MIKKIFLIASFASLILGIFPNSFKKAKAEENNLITIGNMYRIERVTTSTKIYIEPSEISFIEEAGRTVYTERKSQTFVGSTPDTFLHYYYADASHGILLEKRELKNDLSSLIFVIKYLETAAEDFGLNTRTKIANMVLEYSRTTNVSYYSSNFNKLMGHANNLSSFINFVNDTSHGGIRPVDYFASFLNYSSCNVSLHGSISETYKNNNYLFQDPFLEQNNTDLVHLMATLDGSIISTGTSPLVSSVIERQTVEFISGWAGDLQSVCYDMRNKNQINLDSFNFANDVLSANTKFPYSDLYADISACLIASKYNNSDTITISDSMISFMFDCYSENYNLMDSFAKEVSLLFNNQSPNYIESFKRCIMNLMALKYSSDNSTIVGISPDYFQANTKYTLLGASEDNPGMPSLDQRIAFMNGFFDYICSFITR